MVMEFMEGGELFERIRKRVSFTEKEACEITKQVFLSDFILISILISNNAHSFLSNISPVAVFLRVC